MTVHTDWKRNKPGLFDQRIHNEKMVSIQATLQNTALKAAVMTVTHGSAIIEAPERAVLFARLLSPLSAPRAHSYSEHGDFTNCYRGGFY